MKLIMTGHYAGKTVKINGHDFVNGVLEMKGDMKAMDGVINYFRTFNAFLAGSDELAEAQARDALNKGGPTNGAGTILAGEGPDTSGVQANGSDPIAGSGSEPIGDSVPTGSGSSGDGVSGGREGGSTSETVDPQVLKIQDSLKALDPTADDHWTDAGLPRVDAIATATGIPNVTRKDIEKAIPGWNREAALAAV